MMTINITAPLPPARPNSPEELDALIERHVARLAPHAPYWLDADTPKDPLVRGVVVQTLAQLTRNLESDELRFRHALPISFDRGPRADGDNFLTELAACPDFTIRAFMRSQTAAHIVADSIDADWIAGPFAAARRRAWTWIHASAFLIIAALILLAWLLGTPGIGVFAAIVCLTWMTVTCYTIAALLATRRSPDLGTPNLGALLRLQVYQSEIGNRSWKRQLFDLTAQLGAPFILGIGAVLVLIFSLHQWSELVAFGWPDVISGYEPATLVVGIIICAFLWLLLASILFFALLRPMIEWFALLGYRVSLWGREQWDGPELWLEKEHERASAPVPATPRYESRLRPLRRRR